MANDKDTMEVLDLSTPHEQVEAFLNAEEMEQIAEAGKRQAAIQLAARHLVNLLLGTMCNGSIDDRVLPSINRELEKVRCHLVKKGPFDK